WIPRKRLETIGTSGVHEGRWQVSRGSPSGRLSSGNKLVVGVADSPALLPNLVCCEVSFCSVAFLSFPLEVGRPLYRRVGSVAEASTRALILEPVMLIKESQSSSVGARTNLMQFLKTLSEFGIRAAAKAMTPLAARCRHAAPSD